MEIKYDNFHVKNGKNEVKDFFGHNYKVAIFDVTVSGIIIPSLKSIGQS